MSEIACPHCGKPVNAEGGIKFCPFCGKPLATPPAQPVSDAERDVLQKAEATDDPVKKHRLLTEAMAAYPQSLPIAEELLYLGRLHERGRGTLDFSVIKCYLLDIYLEPDVIPPAKVNAMRAELFSHPDLDRCLALAPDADAFLARYLNRLCCQFIDLFLRGSSKYMRRIFGLGLDSRAPKLLASPTARMLAAMQGDAALSQPQRDLLMRALFDAFDTQLGGDTQWLMTESAALGVRLP
jgi:hypothetical protein